jgi:Na+-driven multidrug efflux pump
MGEQELAASHIVRNLFFISFIPIFGFGSSTRTYVSYYFGRKEYKNIKLVLPKMIILSFIVYITIFHGALLYPQVMTQLYPWVTDLLYPEFIQYKEVYNPETLCQASEILKIIFGSMLLYAVINIIYNTISAIGQTLHALLIEVFAIIIYLSFTYLFIVEWQWSIIDIWYVEYIYFGTLGIFSLAYLYYFNKKLNQKTLNDE